MDRMEPENIKSDKTIFKYFKVPPILAYKLKVWLMP